MYALYSRVSTKEQVEGYSISEQQEKMKAYCEAKGFKMYELYTDAGFSGGNIERPALTRLIQDVKDNKIDAVIVYKLDRLSRSQKDTLNLIEDVFLASSCDFISISENFDTTSPFGRAMIGILSVFAQLEREQIKERMNLGMEGRAKEGYFHGGGYSPYGYNYIDGELVIDHFEAEAVKLAFKWYLEGYSLGKIARELNNKGYKRKTGDNSVFVPGKVRRLLSNNIYTGIVKYNGIEYPGRHEPIIDADTFNRVQPILKANAINPKGLTYLGGLLWCKKCGHRYTITGSKYKYYICSSYRTNPKGFKKCCDNKYWRMEKLDQLVLDQLDQLDFEAITQEPIKPKIEPLQEEIKAIDGKINKLLDIYLIDGIDKSALEAKISDFKNNQIKLKQQIEELQESAKNKQNKIDIINSWSKLVEEGSKEQVRDILHALISRIDIEGEDVYIEWNL